MRTLMLALSAILVLSGCTSIVESSYREEALLRISYDFGKEVVTDSKTLADTAHMRGLTHVALALRVSRCAIWSMIMKDDPLTIERLAELRSEWNAVRTLALEGTEDPPLSLESRNDLIEKVILCEANIEKISPSSNASPI